MLNQLNEEKENTEVNRIVILLLCSLMLSAYEYALVNYGNKRIVLFVFAQKFVHQKFIRIFIFI